MKTSFALYLVVIFFFITSCLSKNKVEDQLGCIDITKNYPEKEILLTDIADITYLHLNTDDDTYLYKGSISCLTKNTIVVVDNVSGSILFFFKNGTPKSRFNHKGQGPGEYRNIPDCVIYDEEENEVFISINSVIHVYSSIGEYKRTLTLPKGTWILPKELILFDDNSLILFNFMTWFERDYAIFKGKNLPTEDFILRFYRISKTDGGVLDTIKLSGTQLLPKLGIYYNERWISPASRHIVKCAEGVLLGNPGTDTIFLYKDDRSLNPVLYQTPSVSSRNPVEYLDLYLEMGQYQFIKVIVARESDNVSNMYDGFFPAKYYMRNKKTGEIARPKLFLPDYKGKEFIISPTEPNGRDYVNSYIFTLDLYELKQAYRENKLSGKLKELVATLKEDEDNDVFMIVNFK